MKWPPSPTVLLGYIAVIATLAAVITGGVALKATHDNRARIDDNVARINDIERTARESCDARNVIRQILRVQIQRQIDQSVAFEESGQYAQFFPNIPTAQLHKILAQQRNSQQSDKEKLAPEDCTKV